MDNRDLTPCNSEGAQRSLLREEGNMRVPCSQYGTNTFQCAEVAIIAERILRREGGDDNTTVADIENMMSLVVNDSDDPGELIRDYGTPDEIYYLQERMDVWVPT